MLQVKIWVQAGTAARHSQVHFSDIQVIVSNINELGQGHMIRNRNKDISLKKSEN